MHGVAAANVRRAAPGSATSGAAAPRARLAAHRLGQHRRRRARARRRAPASRIEDEPGRVRGVLDEQAGAERAEATPVGGDAGDQRAEPRTVRRLGRAGSAEHADGRAGGQACTTRADEERRRHCPRRGRSPWRGPGRSARRRGRAGARRWSESRPTVSRLSSSVEHVDGEDRRSASAAEKPNSRLVDRVQRARRTRRGQQDGPSRRPPARTAAAEAERTGWRRGDPRLPTGAAGSRPVDITLTDGHERLRMGCSFDLHQRVQSVHRRERSKKVEL